MKTKKIYVTYNRRSLMNNTIFQTRFAVECENEEQANKVGYNLNSRPGVLNVRVNECGKGLPCEAAIFPYHEYAQMEGLN
jgi:hypothetical protein